MHRPNAESTHVLCRHTDEATPDFVNRVLCRIQRIQKTRRIRAVWYVVGSGRCADDYCSVPLLHSLLPLLEPDSRLTIVGPESQQEAVVHWIDGLTSRRDYDVSVNAELHSEADIAHWLRSARTRAPSGAVRAVPRFAEHELSELARG